MRAIVTGITGFAGGHLAELLLASGDEVLGISHRGQWAETSPPSIREIPLVSWNLGRGSPASGDELSELPANEFARLRDFAPECVYHLAAESIPFRCGEHEPSPRALAINVDGTRRVAALVRRLPGQPRLLFSSSSHVYGPGRSDLLPIDESAPTSPTKGYGLSKLAAERLLIEAAAAGLDVVIARAFQQAGPRQQPELMLAEWTRQLLSGGCEPMQVRSLHTWIDLADVRDVVRAYRLLVLHGERGGVYNVGSGEPRQTGEVLERLIATASGPIPAIEEMSSTPRYNPVADIARLIACTDWRREISLEQMLADTVADWRSRLTNANAD